MNIQSSPTKVHAAPLPLLELDVLRTFVAIAETGSFSAAAEQVFRTPSAVSMQIKKLEDTLGRTVLRRDARSVSLTADGDILIGYARRLLAINREAVAAFLVPDLSGIVRLGAPDDVSERFLPEMLRRFGESHPGVSVNVVVESSAELLARIDRKELDLTLVTCGSGFAATERAEILMSEKLVWASLKGGCAVMRDPLPISVWETGCLWRKAAIDGLEAAGRPYRISFQSAYISAQKAAILADLAVAPMPASALSGDIVATPSKHGLPPLMNYSLGMVVADDASAPVRAAADHLRASFAQCCEERGLAA